MSKEKNLSNTPQPTISTGVKELDSQLGDLRKGEVFAIEAAPFIFRSIFTTSILLHCANIGLNCVYLPIFANQKPEKKYFKYLLNENKEFNKRRVKRNTKICPDSILSLWQLSKVYFNRHRKPDVVIIDECDFLAGPHGQVFWDLKNIAVDYDICFIVSSETIDRGDGSWVDFSYQGLEDTVSRIIKIDYELLKNGEPPIFHINIIKNEFGKTGYCCSYKLSEEILDLDNPTPQKKKNKKKVTT